MRIDIETYSSVDISNGVHAYCSATDFKILLFGYAFDDDPVQVIDLTKDTLPAEILRALLSNDVLKTAFNASFEITCLSKYLHCELHIWQWRCTSVLALNCGLPNNLNGVATALKLANSKDSSGKLLINYFSKPCKPSKTNGMRSRNLPEHHPERWEMFKSYCAQDVVVERDIHKKLAGIFDQGEKEYKLWQLDQKINNTGVLIDTNMVNHAIACDNMAREHALQELIEISGLANPNSNSQLRFWLSEQLGTKINSLTKDSVRELLIDRSIPKQIKQVLKLKQIIAKTSTKKYVAMINAVCLDNRIRGTMQFYGANRTGRWAGRLIQVHNLPQNHLAHLDETRQLLAAGQYEELELLYDSVPNVLSQLIRTAIVAEQGSRFIVADFSSIEARVIAWLAGEQWRLDIFNTTGKIYEASASKMFNVPIEKITKGSDLRQKGKVAELALGYQGGVSALCAMGADKMGLSENELEEIVGKWRKASPKIVKLWYDIESAAKDVVKGLGPRSVRGVKLYKHKGMLLIELASGRKLAYIRAKLAINRFGREAIVFEGVDQKTKKWGTTDTYGGKLVENIVQAIARDCLAEVLLKLDAANYKIVMHVHDEVILETPYGQGSLDEVINIMRSGEPWQKDLPLDAAGYETEYYRKD